MTNRRNGEVAARGSFVSVFVDKSDRKPCPIPDTLREAIIALHFHNTRGIGLANVMNGLALGVREYESSFGGLGGCPFAPGATGNVCTEDMVHMLQAMGYDTGVDLARLIDASHLLRSTVAHALPGQVAQAEARGETGAVAVETAAKQPLWNVISLPFVVGLGIVLGGGLLSGGPAGRENAGLGSGGGS